MRSFFILSLALLGLFLFSPASSATISGRVNINQANVKELQQLPFIGESRARAIVRYRRENGPFPDTAALTNIPIIGEETLAAITPYVTVSGKSTIKRRTSQGKGRVFPRINTTTGEIIILPNERYFPALMGAIQRAKREITITMFLFKVSKSKKNRARMLADELIAARKRGVSVAVTLERSDYDQNINKENKRVARRLKKRGIKVRFDSLKQTSHAKLVVIDGRFSFVGSHNFTHSALRYNNEMSLLIDSPLLAQELKEYISHIE